jgi:hypothetical protein
MGFIEIAIIVAVLLGVAIVVATVMLNKASRVGAPSCASCGYPTRGIAELVCPECGADLTKVGIALPSDNRNWLAKALHAVLASILILVLAIAGGVFSNYVVPTYKHQSTVFTLSPQSDAYDEVNIRTDLTLIIPPRDARNSRWFDAQSTYNSPPTVSIDFGGGTNAKMKVNTLALDTSNMQQNRSGNTYTYTQIYTPTLRIAPNTGVASWSDKQNTQHTTTSSITQQDLLDYFAQNGIDTTSNEVKDEAKELVRLIDAILAGQNQVTLTGFNSGGYGSGGSSEVGPSWFIGTYILAWILIWIITLIFIIRRKPKT